MIDVQLSGYGTHLIPLVSAASHLSWDDYKDNRIVEFGCGIFSTPILNVLSKSGDIGFTSYDDNLQWINKVKEITDANIIHVPDWNKLDLGHGFYDFVFMDCGPVAEIRHQIILKMINNGLFHNKTIVVLHDANPEHDFMYQYSKLMKYFKFNWSYTKLSPHTLILSNYNYDIKF